MIGQPSAITTAMPASEALRRLESQVSREGAGGAIIGELSGHGYVGSFNGTRFRVRLARPLSQFYATYLFGRVDGRGASSLITFRFGHRRSADWALWIMRFLGAFITVGALLAAFHQPVFLFFSAFVALGTGLLLWTYRLRDGDKEQLRSFLAVAFHAETRDPPRRPTANGPRRDTSTS